MCRTCTLNDTYGTSLRDVDVSNVSRAFCCTIRRSRSCCAHQIGQLRTCTCFTGCSLDIMPNVPLHIAELMASSSPLATGIVAYDNR
jgi:hypothetical protein